MSTTRVEDLRHAIHSVPATTPCFWEVIASKVGNGCTPRECCVRYLESRGKVTSRETAEKKKGKNDLKQCQTDGCLEPSEVVGRPGTIKFKRQVRSALERADQQHQADSVFDHLEELPLRRPSLPVGSRDDSLAVAIADAGETRTNRKQKKTTRKTNARRNKNNKTTSSTCEKLFDEPSPASPEPELLEEADLLLHGLHRPCSLSWDWGSSCLPERRRVADLTVSRYKRAKRGGGRGGGGGGGGGGSSNHSTASSSTDTSCSSFSSSSASSCPSTIGGGGGGASGTTAGTPLSPGGLQQKFARSKMLGGDSSSDDNEGEDPGSGSDDAFL